MTADEFKRLILLKKPRYAKSRTQLIEAFANKGKSKSEYSQFGPIYELYIYAFILGLKTNTQIPLPSRDLTSDFVEIGKWQRGGNLVDFLLMIIFSKSDQLGFTWNELEDLEESELNSKVSDVITFMESYANGGFDYLQNEWEQDNLINSPYMFVDMLAENSTFEKEIGNDIGLELIAVDENLESSTQQLIDIGESPRTEFKSTFLVNLRNDLKQDPKMELACLKTIVGFMNTKPGTLLIGVEDNKNLLGLSSDFSLFESKHDPMDEFQKRLDQSIGTHIGNSAFSLIDLSFPKLDDIQICRLDVKQSTKGPVFLKNKISKKEEFYIRRSASTVQLSASEMSAYITNHWS